MTCGAVCLVALVGCSATSGGPTSARSLRFTVAYADNSAHEVQVSYGQVGEASRQVVARTSWTSPAIQVKKGLHYKLTSEGPVLGRVSSECGVETSNGWVGANTSPSGRCTYTFPDDASN